MLNEKVVSIKMIEKPERKVIIKRGIKATEYWSYCNEVGCEVWDILKNIKSLDDEPVCLWLPKKYILPNTSEYVMGAEVPCNYSGDIPNGFDIITLPVAKYLIFQSEPYAEEEYCKAIQNLQSYIEKFDLSTLNYKYDAENPHIQLEPKGERGYIELIPIKEL